MPRCSAFHSTPPMGWGLTPTSHHTCPVFSFRLQDRTLDTVFDFIDFHRWIKLNGIRRGNHSRETSLALLFALESRNLVHIIFPWEDGTTGFVRQNDETNSGRLLDSSTGWRYGYVYGSVKSTSRRVQSAEASASIAGAIPIHEVTLTNALTLCFEIIKGSA